MDDNVQRIEITHLSGPRKQTEAHDPRLVWWSLGAMVLLFGALVVAMCVDPSSSSHGSHALHRTKTADPTVAQIYGIAHRNDVPVLIYAVESNAANASKNTSSDRRLEIRRFDLKNERALGGKTRLPAALYNAPQRRFANGDIYMLTTAPARMYRLRIDAETPSIQDLTSDILDKHPPLGTSLSKVSFVSTNDGDGVRIMTSAGQQYFYFPLADRLYQNLPTSPQLDPAHAAEQRMYQLHWEDGAWALFRAQWTVTPGYPLGGQHMQMARSDAAVRPSKDGAVRWKRQQDALPEAAASARHAPQILHVDPDTLYLSFEQQDAQQTHHVLLALDANTYRQLWAYTPRHAQAPRVLDVDAKGLWVAFDDHVLYLQKDGTVAHAFSAAVLARTKDASAEEKDGD